MFTGPFDKARLANPVVLASKVPLIELPESQLADVPPPSTIVPP
jgi:hypothetical protein